MTEKSRRAETENASDKRRASRKPYQKPEFRHEKVFETMALACGKVSPIQAQCRFNRRNS
jgi:hypothetical protein